MANLKINSFPAQKIPNSKKSKKWKEDCVDTICDIVVTGNDYMRVSYERKTYNKRLRAGKLDPEQLKKYLDPYSLGDSALPETIEHIGIGNNKIERLLGEEHDVDDNIRILTSNKDRDGISMKERETRQMLLSRVDTIIKAKNENPTLVEEELRDFQNYLTYEYQDIRERLATEILHRELKKTEWTYKKTRFYDNLLTFGEEIGWVGMVNRRPEMQVLDPTRVGRLGGLSSEKFEDSDIIFDWDYYPVGKVVDMFGDYLKPAQIDLLERGGEQQTSASGQIAPAVYYPNLPADFVLGTELSEIYLVNPAQNTTHQGAFNTHGEILVIKGNWRSFERIGILTYFDELGDEQQMYVPDGYIPDSAAGETIEWEWRVQWWEFVRLGTDIYPYIRPIEYDSSDPVSPSGTLPCYIGVINNRTHGSGFSFLDLIKPLDITYSVIYDKLMNEVATHQGSILAYSTALIPQGWDMTKWLNYVFKKKSMPLDPTAEILKGPSQGKSGGAYNQLTAEVLNFSNADTIQSYMGVLSMLDNLMSKVSGISEQREGDISASEKVRNAQLAQANSQLVTQGWTALHGMFKKRLLQKYFEVLKYAYKKHKKMGEYAFDTLQQEMIDEYNNMLETHHDIFIDIPSAGEKKLEANMDRYIDFGLQAGTTTIPQAIMLHKSNDILDQARKIENMAAALEERKSEMEKMNAQILQQKQEQDHALKVRELDLKEKEIELKYSQEVNTQENTPPDHNAENNAHDALQNTLDRSKDLAIQQSKERIDKYKADTQLKVAKENKNKYDSKTTK